MISAEPEIDQLPLVSVLMPCYNHETYIISSLESVAASDYKSIEFILIDDASNDNSFGLASEWIEKNKHRFARTVCIQHERNQGICVTLNELYALSHGDYVTFAASDDLVLASAISNQVSFALRREVDFVFSDCRLIDETGQQVADSALRYFGKNSQGLKRISCLTADIIFFWELPWNKIFMKSSLAQKIGLFDESLGFEDRDFVIRVLIDGSFGFLPEATTAYRIRLKNRLTPGLAFEDLMSDFRKADCKNYLDSSGITRLLLGIVVYSYPERYMDLGIKNAKLIWFATRMAGQLKRMVFKMHRALVRCI